MESSNSDLFTNLGPPTLIGQLHRHQGEGAAALAKVDEAARVERGTETNKPI